MSHGITLLEITEALSELSSVYKPGAGDAQKLAATYHRALKDLPHGAVKRAAERYIRSTKRFFPKPGELRELARPETDRVEATTLLGKYQAWQTRADWWTEPCPVCGMTLQLPPPGDTRRIQMRHDHQRHYEANIGYAGEPTGPSDAKGHMLPIGETSTQRTIAPAAPQPELLPELA